MPALILLSIVASACGSGAGPSRQVPIGPTEPTPSGGGGGSVTLSTPSAVSPVNNEQLRDAAADTDRTELPPPADRARARTSSKCRITPASPLARHLRFRSWLRSARPAWPREATAARRSRSRRICSRRRTCTGERGRLRARPRQRGRNRRGFARSRRGTREPGELYNPLIHGETIGTVVGAHTWVAGKGIRLDTERSYVRYQLAEAMTSGEVSVEVEGLHPNGPNHKLKIFSMNSSDSDPSFSDNGMSTMYRGLDGNPPNAVAFKAVFGDQSRIAGARALAARCRRPDAGSVKGLFLAGNVGFQFPPPGFRWRR